MKTYKCKYCGKGGFKSPAEVAQHSRLCPTAIKERSKQKPKRGRKIGVSPNLRYVPMMLVLNFANQTFEIVGTTEA